MCVHFIPYRTCYIAIPLYICGFVVLGAAIQNHLTIGALVMGWGIAEVAVMINTVAVCESLLREEVEFRVSMLTGPEIDAYCNDCFPRHQVSYMNGSTKPEIHHHDYRERYPL